MKKIGIWVVGAAMLMSSCDTYTGQGAYAGGTIGAILGSAIGGVSGGWRGSDIGTIVGMAGGAAVGAAIGAQADKAQAEKYEAYKRERERRMAEREGRYGNDDYPQQVYQSSDSGFDDTNSGDDRVDFGIAGPKDTKGQGAKDTRSQENKEVWKKGDKEMGTFNPSTDRLVDKSRPERIVIRNARFVDQDLDGVLRGGEQCQITFEIMNFTRHTLYDVQPMVYDVTGNKNIHISPNLHVESIAPNSGVRYTATILADQKLKDGTAKIRVGATVNNQEIESNAHDIIVVTRRK
jgi:hypothetical protein